MSAEAWLAGNASLEAAHAKYGQEFEVAFREFRADGSGVALWNDYANRGENIMSWYRQRRA